MESQEEVPGFFMERTTKKFFIDLPAGKSKGFCEPPEGDPNHSLVVILESDCRTCNFSECHMFKPIIEDGAIVARRFIQHDSEY